MKQDCQLIASHVTFKWKMIYLSECEYTEVRIGHITIIWRVFFRAKFIRFKSMFIKSACFLRHGSCLWIGRRFQYGALTCDFVYCKEAWVGTSKK